MPNVGRPDVDTLRNLSAAILVNPERKGANSRSTVGTATDAYSMLRLIYSRIGEPHVGHSSMVSFNDPQGMCVLVLDEPTTGLHMDHVDKLVHLMDAPSSIVAGR